MQPIWLYISIQSTAVALLFIGKIFFQSSKHHQICMALVKSAKKKLKPRFRGVFQARGITMLESHRLEDRRARFCNSKTAALQSDFCPSNFCIPLLEITIWYTFKVSANKESRVHLSKGQPLVLVGHSTREWVCRISVLSIFVWLIYSLVNPTERMASTMVLSKPLLLQVALCRCSQQHGHSVCKHRAPCEALTSCCKSTQHCRQAL